jgi:hypothetical protein
MNLVDWINIFDVYLFNSNGKNREKVWKTTTFFATETSKMMKFAGTGQNMNKVPVIWKNKCY